MSFDRTVSRKLFNSTPPSNLFSFVSNNQGLILGVRDISELNIVVLHNYIDREICKLCPILVVRDISELKNNNNNDNNS